MVKKILIGFLGASILTGPAYAAFTETAIGSAVVYDASAVYFNPAALSLIPNPQLVASDGYASLRNTFHGTATQNNPTNYSETGTANSRTRYTLPAAYYAMPVNQKLTVGIGGLYTFAGATQYPTSSIIRYLQTYSFLSVYDVMLAISYRINNMVSVGIGSDFETAAITLDSEVGNPLLNVPDVQTHNHATDSSWGGHAGILITPRLGTVIGLTYHSAVSYSMNGYSTFESNPELTNNNLKIKLLTPSSVVFSINQFVSPQLGFIATLQRMNWSVNRNLNLRNVIVKIGPTTVVLPSSVIPAYLHDTWRFLLASQYNSPSKWAFRVTGAYDQDPTNPSAGFSNGTNIILAVGTGYQFNKQVRLDVNYAHVFYRATQLNFTSTSQVIGRADGGRDFIGAQLTVDFAKSKNVT